MNPGIDTLPSKFICNADSSLKLLVPGTVILEHMVAVGPDGLKSSSPQFIFFELTFLIEPRSPA